MRARSCWRAGRSDSGAQARAGRMDTMRFLSAGIGSGLPQCGDRELGRRAQRVHKEMPAQRRERVEMAREHENLFHS